METYKCEKCSQEISENVAKYSQDKFKKYLCMDCQKKEKKTENKETKLIGTKTIKLHGKDYVTYEGLLDKAHKSGLMKIITEVINVEKTDFKKGPVVVKATVNMTQETGTKDKEGNKHYWHKQFTGIGDASDDNVSDNVKKHIIRMAETRAICRALRSATNIGMCSVEELEKTEDKKGSP